MIKNPKITVIVPIYNVESYLQRCLSSIRDQIYGNLQIVLIDDGSTDSSGKIADKYSKVDQRVEVYHIENHGAAYARNLGLEKANGNFIMFLDSDDWLELDCIDECVKIAAKYENIECILFPYMREYGDRSGIQYTLGKKDKYYAFKDLNHNELLRRVIGLMNFEMERPDSMNDINGPGGKMCMSHCYQNIRYPLRDTIECGEDGWFSSLLFVNISSAFYIAKPFYHYDKTNTASLVHGYHDNLLNQYKRQWKHMSVLINKYSLGKDFFEALNNRILGSCLDLTRNILHSDKKIQDKYKSVANILNDIDIRSAFEHSSLSKMNWKWMIYYWLCKQRMIYGVIFMTVLAEKLRKYLR